MLKYFANQPSYKRCKASNGPSFAFVGSNLAFQAALIEASYTGLALGFSAPTEPPQYWLRGARYANFLGVPGATYTRTGNRAGLDAAVIYPANVPRIASSVGPGPEQRSTGAAGLLGVATAATFNTTTFAGAATRVDVSNQSFVVFTGFTPNALVQITAECLTNAIIIRDSNVPSNVGSNVGATISAGQTVTSTIRATSAGTMGVASSGNGTTSTFIVHSVREYRDAGSGLRVFGAGTNLVRSSDAPSTQSFTVAAVVHTLSIFGTGSVTLSGAATGTLNGTGASNRVALTFTPTAATLTLTVSGSVTFAQIEQSAFATDYIPNPNTGASSSAGADDVLVNLVTAGIDVNRPMTLIYQYVNSGNGQASSAEATLFQDSAPTTNRVSSRSQPDGVAVFTRSGVGASIFYAAPTPAVGNVVTVAVSVSAAQFAIARTGNASVVSTSVGGSPLSLDRLGIGKTEGTSAYSNTGIQSVALIPRALSNAEILALVA